jgi:hypothetical protein
LNCSQAGAHASACRTAEIVIDELNREILLSKEREARKEHYLRADRAIADEADRIAREVHRLGVDYIAYDSVAFACAGAPEAAEQASIYSVPSGRSARAR